MTAMAIRKAGLVNDDIEVSVPEVSVVWPIGTISKSATQAAMSAYGLCALQVSQKPWQNISVCTVGAMVVSSATQTSSPPACGQ